MIGLIANLIRWEWFKLSRRWMPWILLIILLLFSQLSIWGGYFSYRSMANSGGRIMMGFEGQGERPVTISCNDLLGGNVPEGLSSEEAALFSQQCQKQAAQNQQQLQDSYATITLPGGVVNALHISEQIGLILIAILAASLIGTDFAWGTMRTVLVKGTGRWQYLASKLVLLVLLAGGAFLLVAAAATLSSAIVGGLTKAGPDGAAVYSWMDVATAFGKAWFALLPYVALAACITMLTSSTAAGMAVALAYNFLETIVSVILFSLFDWFGTVADYLVGRNITAWMASGREQGVREVLGGVTGLGNFPGALHAFLVMVVYIVVLGGLAFWILRRRDITGGSAG